MSTPVVIDCDPGVDDAIALLLALATPALDVRGITTVAGNVPVERTARNALQLTELAGRTDVPVHAGCSRPLVNPPMHGLFHGTTGLGTTVLPEPRARLAEGHAVLFLAAQLEAAQRTSQPLTICTLGPMTNLAMLLRLRPDLQPGIARIVSMGGAYREAGNRTITSEFNVLADPHAAHIVFSSSIPITSLALDATHQVMATPERASAFQDLDSEPGRVVAALLAQWDRNDLARYGSRGGPMHDPLVPAAIIAPHLFETRPAHVFVECASPLSMGQTLADWHGKSREAPNVDIVVKADAEGFFALLRRELERYGRDRPRPPREP